MKLIKSIEPTSEPVSLEEMKNFLRVLRDNDDTLIESYITAAREKAESIMNIQLIECTYELYLDATQSEIALSRPPFVSIESFQAYDGIIWNDVTGYDLDDKVLPAKVYVQSYPAIASTKNSIKIVYKSGYADADSVPERIKAWIRFEVEMMYDQEKPRVKVDSLLTPFRVIPL